MILSLINEQDRYGYEIVQELEKRSNNIFEMKEGTLYPILHRLEKKGYLKSYTKTMENGRKRKYYQITKDGAKQLQVDKETWTEFSESVKMVVDGKRMTFD
ncbi:PadR family transcriptional regulator [Erysipelothrix urinaevulpis]